MWCELAMVPNMAAMYTGGVSGATTPTIATPTASTLPVYPPLSAVIGLPVGKDIKLALPAVQQQNSPTSAQKVDTSKHYHIFVGDLAPEVEPNFLKDIFSSFGTVTECKIIKDMHTQKPKGYGFVAFAEKEPAEEAMLKMNGQLIGSRTIRTNWAVRRPPQPPDQKPLDYEEVNKAASNSNCTVYVGGITKGLCEDLLRENFKEYGDIHEVRIFKEKGYAFVRFNTHEAATRAIITMHGKEVGGQPCKCSWGKESNDSKEDPQTLLNPYNYYANQLGFGYNQVGYLPPQLNYSLPSYATTATSAFPGRAATTNLLNSYALAAHQASAAATQTSFTMAGAAGSHAGLAAGYPFSAATLHPGLTHHTPNSTGLQYA